MVKHCFNYYALRFMWLMVLLTLAGCVTQAVEQADASAGETEILGMRGILSELAHGVAVGIEVAGIGVIVLGALLASGLFVWDWISRRPFTEIYQLYRERLGQAILLGLEFLVAADIIGTVAVAPTFENVGVLGAIVIIRTFLSFALEVEIKGHWPWQTAKAKNHEE